MTIARSKLLLSRLLPLLRERSDSNHGTENDMEHQVLDVVRFICQCSNLLFACIFGESEFWRHNKSWSQLRFQVYNTNSRTETLGNPESEEIAGYTDPDVRLGTRSGQVDKAVMVSEQAAVVASSAFLA